MTTDIPVRPARHFLPEDFKVGSWEGLKPFYDALLAKAIASPEDLRIWLRDRSELESAISEDMGWKYIRMTCFTENAEYLKAYQDFVQDIQPQIAPVADLLNRKVADSAFLNGLAKEHDLTFLFATSRKTLTFSGRKCSVVYRDQYRNTKYAQLSGAMTIEIDGKEMTLPQAGVLLMSTDRAKREDVFTKITIRRLADKEVLDQLYSTLITLRDKVANNAGFKNFRDYMFKSYGRFDYTPRDCFNFHDSIGKEVVPLLNEFAQQRKDQLGVKLLRPWDKAVDTKGRQALHAFEGGKDLIVKSIETFKKLDPYLGECLTVMNEMGHLDLESRKGKAPGGYNYPLAEMGVPFIFMNATSTLRDLTTIMHEGGHAVHNFLTRDLELGDFKSPPMEVAELASMSMELLTMDYWNIFFTNEADLKRAKYEHLEDLIETLPWVATIDKFQHWVYENPKHTLTERKEHWNRIYKEFSDTVTDWHGLEEGRDYLWQKQLHLYEVPFYYIEYGMAQLGAIAVWRNYKQNNKAGLEGYINALKLGNLRTIPEIYHAANIKFDFSREYIKELMGFVRAELAKI